MPELPELEVVKDVLARRLVGRAIVRVDVAPRGGPIVVRDLTGLGFAGLLTGARFRSVARRGKFLVFDLSDTPPPAKDLKIALNPKLSGRLQLCPPEAKKVGPVHVSLCFEFPTEELRYVDAKRMGQIYLTTDLAQVPTFSEMGPDALDVSLDAFLDRLRPYRGEIKGVLTRATFLAGIGNAYADEILWEARLHPYRKRTSLTPEELARLYQAMRDVLLHAITQVRQEMGEDIHLKPRDFFSVHLREGRPCPRCHTPISAITAHQRITNFCRTCQPGGLIPGM